MCAKGQRSIAASSVHPFQASFLYLKLHFSCTALCLVGSRSRYASVVTWEAVCTCARLTSLCSFYLAGYSL